MNQETTGMLSRGRIGALHDGQAEGGQARYRQEPGHRGAVRHHSNSDDHLFQRWRNGQQEGRPQQQERSQGSYRRIALRTAGGIRLGWGGLDVVEKLGRTMFLRVGRVGRLR